MNVSRKPILDLDVLRDALRLRYQADDLTTWSAFEDLLDIRQGAIESFIEGGPISIHAMVVLADCIGQPLTTMVDEQAASWQREAVEALSSDDAVKDARRALATDRAQQQRSASLNQGL